MKQRVFIFLFALISLALCANAISNDEALEGAILSKNEGGELPDTGNHDIQRLTNSWTGNTSTNWGTVSNWNQGHIPTASEDVVIQTAVRYPVVTGSYSCNSVTVNSGASLTIGSGSLSVATNVDCTGTLGMTSVSGALTVTGNLFFRSGSGSNFTQDGIVFIQGYLQFDSGNTVNMNYGYIEFTGSVNSSIRTGGSAAIKHLRCSKAGATLTISSLSSATLTINGNVYVNNGCTFTHPYTGTTVLKGSFQSYTGGLVNFGSGTLSMEGSSNSSVNFVDSNCYLNRLTVNKNVGVTVDLATTVRINNNVLISGGILSAAAQIYVGGNWTNNVGVGGFSPGASRVVFNGTGYQYCYSNETFNILEVNKIGGSFRVSTSSVTVTCASYDWTLGTVEISAGTFSANALADDCIRGTWILQAGGNINLTNSSGYVDLVGDLYIYGGSFMVYGGLASSVWPYSVNASLTMSGGVLDFVNQGVTMSTTGTYTLGLNISGGIIKVARSLTINRTDFIPSGGSVWLTSSTDASVSHYSGSSFYNLEIHKGALREEPRGPLYDYDRAGNRTELTRSNTATLTSNINVRYDLKIYSGVLNAGNRTITVRRDWVNYAGTAGFAEGTSTVVFGGDISSICSNETFYNIELNKSAAVYELLITNSGWPTATVTCTSYNWTNGTLRVSTANFVAYDLMDSGIYGKIQLDSGSINLYQDTNQFFDLRGTLMVYGGELHLRGGGGDSWWPNIDPGTLTMSGGLIDFHNTGLRINTGTLTTNITGGTIRMAGNFTCLNSTFNASGGTIEMYSATDATIYMTTGHIYDLKINKAATREEEGWEEDLTVRTGRDGEILPLTRALTVSLTNTAVCYHDLIVQSGTLWLNSYAMQVIGSAHIYGTLRMDNASAQLDVTGDAAWHSGSIGQVSLGSITCRSSWHAYSGANVTFPAAVTTNLSTGTGLKDIHIEAAGFQFGNLVINSGQAHSTVSSNTQDLILNGYLTIASGSTLNIAYRDLFTVGNVNLNGTLNMQSHHASVSGKLLTGPVSTLSIGSGSFVFTDATEPQLTVLYGTLNIDSGAFNAVNNRLEMYALSETTLNSGTISCDGIVATLPGNFQPVGGTVVLTGNLSGINGVIEVSGGNWLPDLLIESNSNGFVLADDLVVLGNLILRQGWLDVTEDNYSITVGGNWQNELTPAAFIERNGQVTFNGSGTQTCSYSEVFYYLKNSKSAGAIRINNPSTTLSCFHYTWDSGAIEVLSGSFVSEGGTGLVESTYTDGVFGTYYCYEGGTIHLGDLYYSGFGGHLFIYGGSVTLNGITGFWMMPTSLSSSLTMSGGILNLNRGLFVESTTTGSFTTNISGGTIKVGGYFICERDDFHPSGGTIEITNNSWMGDSHFINMQPGSNFHNLTITKYWNEISYLQTDIVVNGNLTCNYGEFRTNGHDILCGGNFEINNEAKALFGQGTVLTMANTKTLSVNNGGTLEIVGNVPENALITASSGKYNFNVESGGNLLAINTIFEHMGVNGINIKNGANVYTTPTMVIPLAGCTFRNGTVGGTLLTIDNAQTLWIIGSVFPTNTWGGASNVRKNLNQGEVTFNSFSGPFSGEAFDFDPYNRLIWLADTIDLQITSVVWSDPDPYVGDIATVQIGVLNSGTVDISQIVYLDLYFNRSTPPPTGLYGDAYISINSLPPGTTQYYSFPVQNSIAGAWNSWAQIDTDEYIEESNESNNVFGPVPVLWQALPVVEPLTIVHVPSSGAIRLQWSYPLSVTHFNVYRSTDPYFIPGPGSFYDYVDGSEYVYNDYEGTSNRYFYRVTADRTARETDSSPSPIRQ